MILFTRRPLKRALWLLALSGAIVLLFQVWRARRLLLNAHQIEIESARFSRDYWIGSGPEISYLAMGDSTAAGWGAGDSGSNSSSNSSYPHQIAVMLAARHFRVHIINVAVGGATLGQVQRDQSRFLNGVRPDLITLGVGANDATRGTSPAVFEREMREMWAKLQSSSARTVLVANVPDMFLAPALPFPVAIVMAKRARALNAVLETLPQNHQLQIVDLFGRGKLDYRRDQSLYASDLFHPSGRGYGVWARLFGEKLPLSARDFSETSKRR